MHKNPCCMLSDTISYRMYNYTYVMEKSKLRKKERRILLALHKNERRYMRKLALDDEILMSIDKAARYIGGEVNSVMKDKGKVDLRFCMAFPDVCGGRCPDSII